MYPDLSGKAVLVTGASSGIGAEIARRFAAEGARVAINYLSSEAAARSVLEAIAGFGGEGMLAPGDVTSKAEVTRLVSAAIERFGRIDVLVNNAGSPVVRATIAELGERDWDRAVGVNLKGIFLVSQAVIPIMRRQRDGRIINVTSIVGTTGESSPHYAAAKGGADAFTKALARELAPDGILVNAVAPGLIDTPIHSKLSGDPRALFERVVPRIPLGRPGVPHDVASWVVFLASEEARFATGQVFHVNGGQLMP